jgi:purine-binding chemotaxis protein CheW
MSAPTQLLTFRIQHRWYACDLLWVREILRRPALTPVDRAPEVVRGLVHLRGQILTALDLEIRLGLPGGSSAPLERCVVFKTSAEFGRLSSPPPDSDQAGTDLIGLFVDAIGDILPRPATLLPPPPDALSGLPAECVSGILPHNGDLVSLLRLGPVLAPAIPA